jgi:hypothetical protein
MPGKGMSVGTLYGRIMKLTRARFGHAVNPHLFRDAAATSIATEDPEHVYVTRSVLGHSTLRTSGSRELYRRKVADLAAALEQPGTREEAFLILRSLVETVHLVPDNGALRVEIRGELAGILALADSKKPAADIRDGLEQIKMVAGVGFEPTTFRL